jgi:hypothetical protein
MQEICHRCGGELSAGEPNAPEGRLLYCAHCGAPQLLLSDYTEPLSTGAETAGASTGMLPPPRPNHVDWRLAVRSSAVVSGIAVVLSVAAARIPNISPLSTIWIISASLTTLALYQRRRPLASMNAGIGAKIGMLVGVTLSFALGAALSVGILVARFGLHALNGVDGEIAQIMKQLTDQVAAKQTIAPEQVAFFNTIQFRTGYMLFVFAIVLVLVFLMSVFGGAVAGLLRTRRSSAA